mmetsp:Transcript_14625/g.28798  ORF Transcript_14625/g.28798 Transcript_14625/m.28798 type:complete len:537 (-) Transcript_14625:16-1626(-)
MEQEQKVSTMKLQGETSAIEPPAADDVPGNRNLQQTQSLNASEVRVKNSNAPPAAHARQTFGYLQTAPLDFGERFAHRLRWSHAVNSSHRLRCALASPVHFLEADVSVGPLRNQAADESCSGSGAKAAAKSTSVRAPNGDAIIMAHYPTERSSDLSLENFIDTVLEFNERILAKLKADSSMQCSTNIPGDGLAMQDSESASSEAFMYEADLNQELNCATSGQLLPVCVGNRKSRRTTDAIPGLRMRKGIKLDFKRWDSVEPTIKHLRNVRAVERLKGHLWLNADVFAGPGSLITPLDAWKFVCLCAENLPDAVLSLGWGSTVLSTTRKYTTEMINRMIELSMCPSVQQSLPCRGLLPETGHDSHSVASSHEASSNDERFCVAPVAACQHMTFAVMAEFALASITPLHRLLDSVPGASLTIYSGVGSLGVTPSMARDFLQAFGAHRCFFDLRVARPWRSVLFGPRSSLEYQGGNSTTAASSMVLARSTCGPPSKLPHKAKASQLERSIGNDTYYVPSTGCRHERMPTGTTNMLIAIV